MWLVVLASPAGASGQPAAPNPAPATGVMPIHATLTSVQGSVMSLKTDDGRSLSAVITPATRIDVVTRRSLADLRQGAYVGSGAISEPDGSLRAQEVHIFAQGGVGEGHRQMGDDPRHTMTNATISQVVPTGQGKTLTLSYPGGQQKLLVSPATPIIGLQGGGIGNLRPGMKMTVLIRPVDAGAATALVIMAGKDGAKPPM